MKNNLAPDNGGLAYRMTGGRVEWEEGRVTESADRVVGGEDDEDETLSKSERAKDCVESWLRDGPVPYQTIINLARAAGIVEKTLRRAKSELGVESRREGFGTGSAWVWELPRRRTRSREGGQTPAEDGHRPGLATFGDNSQKPVENPEDGHPGNMTIFDAVSAGDDHLRAEPPKGGFAPHGSEGGA